MPKFQGGRPIFGGACGCSIDDQAAEIAPDPSVCENGLPLFKIAGRPAACFWLGPGPGRCDARRGQGVWLRS